MWKRITGYLAVLLLMAYLFFMYDDRVLSGMLVFTVLYPFASALFLALVRGKVRADPDRVPAMGEAGKEIRAGITVENRSAFFVLSYEVCVRIGSRCGGSGRKRRFRGALSPLGSETLWCGVRTALCGSTEIRLESVRIFDPLSVFFLRRKEQKKAVVKVMPDFEPMAVEITRRTREFQAEAEEYASDRRGNDPSQIWQIREYRPGDPLRDIHWKLTAKEGELMVKEHSFPSGCAVLIRIELKRADYSEEGFSEMIRRAASLSVTLAEEKCVHMAAWYEEKNERIVRWRVDGAERVHEMIWDLLDAEPCADAEKMEACFEDAFRGVMFAAVVTLDAAGRIRKDGREEAFLRL